MLLGLLAVADRGGAALAGRAIAADLQDRGQLGDDPEVTVRGVPFLSQAVRGRYRSIEVRTRDVDGGEVVLRTLTAHLSGARVPLSDAVSGDVTDVPVDRVDAVALVTYAELERSAGDGEITLEPEGQMLRVRGEARVLGQDVAATALSRLSVEEGRLVLTAESFDVGNDAVGEVLTGALRGQLDLTVDLGALPYDLQVQDVQVRADGLAVRASAADTVLTVSPA